MKCHLKQNGLPLGTVTCVRPYHWTVEPPFGIQFTGKQSYRTFNQAAQALHSCNLATAKLILEAYGNHLPDGVKHEF